MTPDTAPSAIKLPDPSALLSDIAKRIHAIRRSRPIAYLSSGDHASLDEMLGRCTGAIGENPIAPMRNRGVEKLRESSERMIPGHSSDTLMSLRRSVIDIVEFLEQMPDGYSRSWKRLEAPSAIDPEVFGEQYGNGPVNVEVRRFGGGGDAITAMAQGLEYPSVMIISLFADQPDTILARARGLLETELKGQEFDDRGNMLLVPIKSAAQAPVALKVGQFLRDKTGGLLLVKGQPNNIVVSRTRNLNAELVARSLGQPQPNPRALMTLGLYFPIIAGAGLTGSDFCRYSANNVDESAPAS
jgi:hypothetical protein